MNSDWKAKMKDIGFGIVAVTKEVTVEVAGEVKSFVKNE
jgi:hypothetical protein